MPGSSLNGCYGYATLEGPGFLLLKQLLISNEDHVKRWSEHG
ncbi:hypothetical protein SD77_2680 [Bacillus badius]|uniref:Mobile element protein n=1 Tax=Bacillus badius TaxID=1455 RepID=A0ABR5AQ73_BACBA|nr:hypothetical protein SD77_2680 [Bacillus badius]